MLSFIARRAWRNTNGVNSDRNDCLVPLGVSKTHGENYRGDPLIGSCSIRVSQPSALKILWGQASYVTVPCLTRVEFSSKVEDPEISRNPSRATVVRRGRNGTRLEIKIAKMKVHLLDVEVLS